MISNSTVPTIGTRKVVTPPSMLMKMPSPEIVQKANSGKAADTSSLGKSAQSQADNQERTAPDVQVHMVRQIDAEEYRARNAAAQALIASGQRGPRQDHAVNQHLKCQRDEGEVDFLQPYADGADCCRHHSRNQQRADKRHRNR